MTQPSSEPADATASPPRFLVVGIGASAGGLEALEALIGHLSSNGMAFVVLQHLAPGRASALGEILGRSTSMKIVTIEDGQRLMPSTIFITPPNADVALQGGVLRLTPPREGGARHSIDMLFRSLAAERGSDAVGVILSGAGSDGTLGLRAIKEEGGITFVQEPSTASQSSMPLSALEAGCADFCLSPAEIGDELVRLGAHPFVAARRPAPLFDQQALAKIFDLLHRAFGVDFSAYKLTTIERRLERRLALQKLERVDDYIKLLESESGELSILFSDLLIGVTGFFRDREPFDALKALVFPRLLADRSPHVPLRIWVPGCSTGEEAYSIAMCLVELLDDRDRSRSPAVQIFATDIDDQALTRARQGIYPQAIELDLAPERLQRFFTKHDKTYQVSRTLRDMVVFAPHNLGKDPPFSRLDLVSCRNVLIYMQAGLQRRALRTFHYALNPDGFLLLGTSESVGDAADLFTLVDRKLKIYAKKNVASAGVFDFTASRLGEGSPPLGLGWAPPGERRPPAVSLQQLADRKILDKYGPPGVLVDDNLEIIQFRGRTGAYLDPMPGTPTFNVLKLVRPELVIPLRAAIEQATRERVAIVSQPVVLWGERGSTAVSLDVMPLLADAGKRCLVVLFHEVPPPTLDAEKAPPESESTAREGRVQRLERELLMSKEYLETTIQELGTANEELQSSNEELQSSNEELQSANEELETSKEELQSTNEELTTVNDELQNRMAQLSVSNDDLQNVLADTGSPLIIVGMDLRIRRFSVAAEKLLNLIGSDIGRPVASLSASLGVQNFEALVSEAINSVREKEQRIRLQDGHSHTLRMVPYRTAELAIRGAVLELTRTPAPRLPSTPPEIHELVGKVLSTLPNALVLLDDQLRIVWSNKAFFDTFQVGTEVLGRPLEEVWGGHELHPDLWKRIEDTVASGSTFHDVEVECPTGQGPARRMRMSAHRLASEVDRPALTLVTMAPSPAEDPAP